MAKGAAYREYEKKKEITTCATYPSDVHMIKAERKNERAVTNEC